MSDTPLNSIKLDWCPKKRGRCFCQTSCPLRTDEEVARANAQEQQLPRVTSPVEWRQSIFLDSDLRTA